MLWLQLQSTVIYKSGHFAEIVERIGEKESRRQWGSALQDYERALQLLRVSQEVKSTKVEALLQSSMLQCHLRLGQFESVLGHVRGLQHASDKIIQESRNHSKVLEASAIPFAVEATWRLGRMGRTNSPDSRAIMKV
mmetsp:Transcript_19462/g.29541  ORF Transcript_19462/g.29541 Transcript_19462/m.29541 type:complete len:137 (-) Transcript_19462:102-512(-)